MSNNNALSGIEEKELLKLFKNGSHQAFCILYTHYHDLLINYCKRHFIDKDETEDIVQDIFLQLWETRDSLNIDLSFTGYVHTLTRNKILSKYRQFNVHSRYIQHLIINSKEVTNETEKLIEYNDYKTLLNTLIESLSQRQKEIFKLSRIEGLTYKEISELLNITVPTVQTHVYLILKKIKVFLSRNKITHLQCIFYSFNIFNVFY